MKQPKTIVRCPEVLARTGLKKPHMYNLIAKRRFPAPVKLGARASGWYEDQINAWIDDPTGWADQQQSQKLASG